MAFDPYLEWLHIPAQRRPPSHHDLLGLPPGPVDPARLEAAILDRMTVVRKYHAGMRSDDAVRLCEELTQAYNCLKDGKSPAAPASGIEKVHEDIPIRQTTDDGLLDDDFDDDDLDKQVIRLDDFDDDLEPIAPLSPEPGSAVASVLFRSDDPAPRRSWFVAMAVGSLALVLFGIAGAFLWWRGADQPAVLTKLAPIEDGSIVVGDSMSFRVQAAVDGIDVAKLAYRLGDVAPEGVKLNPVTGEFTWKPGDESAIGVHRFAVRIGPVDSDEVFDEASFQVVVRPAPKPTPPRVATPEPVKPATPAPIQIADGLDYEREAAEWLLGVGGKVTIRDESIRLIEVTSAVELPSSRFNVMSFQLPDASTKQLWLPGLHRLARLSERPPIWATVIPGLADADLKHFHAWQKLESMRLDGPEITDGAIEHLSALRGLKWLRLESTKITEDGRRRLVVALPECVVVMNPHPRTRRAPVSSEAEAHREAAKWVIEQGGEVGVIVPGKPEAICTLVDQLPWQGFWVVSFSVSDRLAPLESADLERFVELATVAQAKLDVASLGESSMSKLRRMTDLQFLTINRAQVADLGFEQLAQCKRLTRLFTGDAKITDANLSRIGRIHSLQELSLTDSAITDRGLQHLKALARLRLLDLTGTQVSDIGLSSLADLPSLTHLGLTRCAVTDAGLPRLSGVAWLSGLWLNETRITDAGTVSVRNWPLLDTLHLGYTTVGDPGIRELETTGIRQLYLAGTDTSDSGIAHLASMTNLTTLDVSETLVTPLALRNLSRLPRLNTLFASLSDSSNASIDALRELTNLKRLELVNFVSDAQTLARVQASLPACAVERVRAKPRQPATGEPGTIADGAPIRQGMPTGLLVGDRPPNLDARAPLHLDDGLGTNPAFTGRESSVGQSGYRSGKLFIRKKPQFSQASEQAKWSDEFAAIEVAGRVTGEKENSWDVTISNPDWLFGLKFSIGSDGSLAVKVQEALKRGATPTLQPAIGGAKDFPSKAKDDAYTFTSPAIKSSENWNRILVVIYREKVAAFVNGVAVCPPCSVARPIAEPTRGLFFLGPEPPTETTPTPSNYLSPPKKVVLSVTSKGEATAEFDEIKVWSAADVLGR